MKNMHTSTIAKILGMNPFMRAKFFIKAIAVVLLMGLLFISNVTMAAVELQQIQHGFGGMVIGLTIVILAVIGHMYFGSAVGVGILLFGFIFLSFPL